jgi:hypothetical protein
MIPDTFCGVFATPGVRQELNLHRILAPVLFRCLSCDHDDGESECPLIYFIPGIIDEILSR